MHPLYINSVSLWVESLCHKLLESFLASGNHKKCSFLTVYHFERKYVTIEAWPRNNKPSQSVLTMTLYKGYECYRNRLTKQFYAMPIGDDTFLNKLTASTPDELKQAIDDATAKQRPNPWDLPYSTAPIAA